MAYFIFDLDGTLLSDEFNIPKNTWKFLMKIKEDGHKLAVATGRPYESTVKKILNPDEFDVLITYNGAQIEINNKITKYALSYRFVKKFISDYSNKRWVIAISIGDDLYTNHPDQATDLINRLKPNVKTLNLLPKNQPIYIMRLISQREEDNPTDLEEIKGLVNLKKYNVVSSTGLYTLINDKSANKLKALELLYKKTNDQCFFFGDSNNDLEVFESKYEWLTCIAPSNAIFEIKKIAKVVLPTTNNQSLAFDYRRFLK